MADYANQDAPPGTDAPAKAPSPFLDIANAPLPAQGLLRRQHWLTVLMPFVVYMVGMFIVGRIELPNEKKPDEKAIKRMGIEEQEEVKRKIPYSYYPTIYSGQIAFTTLAMLLVIPGYLAFRGRPGMLAVLVGVGGAVLWIGLCKLHLEERILGPLGLGKFMDFGRRPGFNPLAELKDNPTWAYQFLAIRLFGLVIVVPIIEEFFLRGWLMRYVMHVRWDEIPFGVVDRTALIAGTAIPMLMHPGELFAAAAWFSLVTWLMLRTRCIWDCVVAHALTNLGIGLWVVVPTLMGKEADWWLM